LKKEGREAKEEGILTRTHINIEVKIEEGE
jgi:hypothetical protein